MKIKLSDLKSLRSKLNGKRISKKSHRKGILSSKDDFPR